MKEKKSESFSLFRKGSTRYSFTSQKKKSEEVSQVQIQRLSWTSPLNKVTVPEESEPCDEISSRLSKSSENLKKQKRGFNNLCKSRSSSFFKTSSSSTIKNIFTVGSSSVSTSSSTSSVASSPNVRQSWSSGVTNILEKAAIEDDHNWEPQVHEYGDQPQNINKPFNYTKNGFPISSLMEEEIESEVMSTPKIICAHKKTPDLSRKQILKELEYIKELGMLPEEIEPNIIANTTPKESNPNPLKDFNLKSFKGYKTLPETQLSPKEVTGDKRNKNVNEHLSSSTQDNQNTSNLNIHNQHVFPKCYQTDSQSSTTSSSCSLSSGNSSSTILDDNQLPALSSPSPHYDSGVDSVGKETLESQGNSDPDVLNSFNNSSLSSILVGSEDDEDSETMSDSDSEIRCCTFETRLEDDLEKLDRKNCRDSQRDSIASAFLSDEEETVQLRRKSRPNLYIDVEKARSQNILTSDRLRRIAENGSASESARSSRSSPRTPRSPAIDIDLVFNERQKKIEESSKDNLSQVKDLTQRLRLSTTSNPTHIDWINGLKNKSDARQLAGIMSPVVVENSEGVFDLKPEGGAGLTQGQREKNMTRALSWIKDELTKMREEDESLARQLVQLQLEMQRLRLHRSCIQHEALLEEVTCEEEEQKAFMTSSSDIIEIPKNMRTYAFPSLRDFGVTRMNIANRRFTLR